MKKLFELIYDFQKLAYHITIYFYFIFSKNFYIHKVINKIVKKMILILRIKKTIIANKALKAINFMTIVKI